MDYMPMKALSTERRAVLAKLRRDGELVITNNGQPTILMIDLSGRDILDVAGHFRKPKDGMTLSQRQNEAIRRFVEDQRADHTEPFDDEYDAFTAQRFGIYRELDV